MIDQKDIELLKKEVEEFKKQIKHIESIKADINTKRAD